MKTKKYMQSTEVEDRAERMITAIQSLKGKRIVSELVLLLEKKAVVSAIEARTFIDALISDGYAKKDGVLITIL